MGGLRYVTGEPDRPPARAGISIGDSLTALHAAGHLRWHQAHRDGHPMESLADAAESAGLGLGDAAPRLTPLVPVP